MHNGRIGLFILSWSTITGYSASILSQLAKNWLVSDSSFFDSWHNISADIQWQWITTRWITLQYTSLNQQILVDISSWSGSAGWWTKMLTEVDESKMKYPMLPDHDSMNNPWVQGILTSFLCIQLYFWFMYDLGKKCYAPQFRPGRIKFMTPRSWQYNTSSSEKQGNEQSTIDIELQDEDKSLMKQFWKFKCRY